MLSSILSDGSLNIAPRRAGPSAAMEASLPAKRADARRETHPVEERRRQILDAAAAVFARRGYHRARTREIADEAGVSEGTVYNYFKSKEDLLISLVGRVALVSLPQVSAFERGEGLRSVLTALLTAWFENIDRNRDLLKAVVPEIISHRELREGYLRQVMLPTVSMFLPLLKQRIQKSELRAFDERVALAVLSTGALGALVVNEYLDLSVGKRLSRAELVEEVVDIFLNGIQRRDGDPQLSPAP